MSIGFELIKKIPLRLLIRVELANYEIAEYINNSVKINLFAHKTSKCLYSIIILQVN
jgi:hypothetical protein